MRRIIFWIAFLWSLCSFSQVIEDFSDGDFTTSPCWNGDADKFVIDKKGQLRLNDKLTGDRIAYLSTPSTLLESTTWKFYVHLYFNPSANNYAKFYLASSEACLSCDLDGYYVMIGGEDDNVALYRQEGDYVEKLIKGASKMVKLNSPELLIKVHRDREGKWTLYSQLIGTDADYVEEGTTVDGIIRTSSYVGVECIYTASRNTSFAFDNIVIKSDDSSVPDVPDEPDEPDIPDPNDTTPPKLVSIFAATDSTLVLYFNEDINMGSAVFNIDLAHKEERRILSADKRTLTLTFSGKFLDDESYTILVSRIKDRSGNYMSDSWINFIYYDASLQTVAFGDLVFSEIMANPKGVNSLPETEYIELHNRTGRPINLNSWMFYYGNKSYKLPEALIPPHGYQVLCNEKVLPLWKEQDIRVVGVKSFPELANTGKLIWLTDARGGLVAWTEYADTWYKDSFKKKGGFSLECVDTDNLSNDADNWSACMDKAGGTPGKENTVKGKYPDETDGKISDAYLLSADTLIIHFSKPMDLYSLGQKDHYTIPGGTVFVKTVTPIVPTGKSVIIVLSDKVQENEVLELELHHLKDISGFDLQGDLTLKTGLPEDASAGEVLFNEILFNPRAGGSDYVEVYNNSEKYINLSRLFFSSRQEDGSLEEGTALTTTPRVMAPYSYLCFTKDVTGVSSQYDCDADHVLAITKLPSLPDDKGNILLLSPAGDVIDEYSYTEKMHTIFLDDKEGISLEKICPDKSSGDPNNWLSASSASGGGTPGYVNSQYRELTADSQDGFWLEQKSFSPNGDGFEDELQVSYRFTGENGVVNIRVYDASGYLVHSIAEDYRLASEGIFTWNGEGAGGGLARIGLYIIYIEAYTPDGKMQRYKFGCALSR